MDEPMDEPLPIDIHYNKLLDWLISRRHCKTEWQEAALVVRERINTAIQDMPPVDEITQLLSGTYITYFHCQKIVTLLRETQDGSRNLFGQYSSQRMKDWIEILKLYEKDDLYLAEVGQMLSRNVNYEIPALKKQVAKCRLTQTECARKEAELLSSSAVLQEKFNSSCRHLGIEGKRIGHELLSLADDLPTTFTRLTQQLKGLQDAVDYYSDFVTFMTGSAEVGESCVPLVKFLTSSGNTTTYEWRVGTAPRRVEEVKRDVHHDRDDDPPDDGATEEIDWGDFEDIGDEIDFGLDGEGSSTDVIITDSDVSINGSEFVKIEVLDNSGTLIDQSEEEGVARGNDALTLLDNPKTRAAFVDELTELAAFLDQRAVQLHRDVTAVHSVQFQGAPPQLERDAAALGALLAAVRAPLVQLTADRMRELMLIRNSPRYVDRMVASLKKIATDSEKMSSLSRLMVMRRDEALEEERTTQPRLDLIRRRTKELQKEISGEISKKYQNRRVNIMGEINVI